MTDETKKEIEQAIAQAALPDTVHPVLRVYVEPVNSHWALKTDAYGNCGVLRIVFREREHAEYALPIYCERIERRDNSEGREKANVVQ
jgi:hypothetical protein